MNMNQVVMISIAGIVIIRVVIIFVCVKNYSKIKQNLQNQSFPKENFSPNGQV